MRVGRQFSRQAAWFAAAAALVCPAAPSAEASGTVFGGVSAGNDRIAYLGVSTPLPGSSVGRGWAVRGIVGAGEYKYVAAVGRVSGKETRGDLSLLYQVSDANNYFDVGVGGRYVHTHLSPRDPGNRRQGGRWEAVASASGQQSAGPWQASEFASYGFRDHDYFVRGDVTHAIAPALRLGVEAQADGARDYSRRAAGAVLAVSPTPRWEVKLSGGVTDQAHRSGGYGAISFRTSF